MVGYFVCYLYRITKTFFQKGLNALMPWGCSSRVNLSICIDSPNSISWGSMFSIEWIVLASSCTTLIIQWAYLMYVHTMTSFCGKWCESTQSNRYIHRIVVSSLYLEQNKITQLMLPLSSKQDTLFLLILQISMSIRNL